MLLAAYGAFLATIPSAIWRALMIIGWLPGTEDLRTYELGQQPGLGYAYVFGLSILQLSAGYLTVGLVRPWGERFLGRRVPLWPVVAVAGAGGLAVTVIFDVMMVGALLNGQRPDQGLVQGGALVLMVTCYLPILLWGPLELAATYGYWRRRTARVPVRPLPACTVHETPP